SLQTLQRTEASYKEDMEIVRLMPRFLKEIFAVGTFDWAWKGGYPEWHKEIVKLRNSRDVIQNAFSKFKLFVDNETYRIKRGDTYRRDPDIGWCHWQEDPPSRVSND
ncbi:hypothetical protein FRC01_001535, partial [Tulasnella sp. 417]